MTERQKRFADEYLIDLNAERAAVRAGYSERYARGNAHKLVANSGVKEYIEERMKSKESELIADQDEVLGFLTETMRDEYCERRDRLKAAELLAKRYGLLTDNVKLTGTAAVKIVDDL